VTGTLNNFIVEPFVPHPADTEFYVCINSAREGDYILFTHEGGVDVGDVDAKALKLLISANPNDPFPSRSQWTSSLLVGVKDNTKKELLTDFLIRLYSVYVELHFAYLEINPLVCMDDGTITYLDMAAKLDQTADFICGHKWSIARDPAIYMGSAALPNGKGGAKGEDRGPPMVWPAPFGRDMTKEEAYIARLDSGTVLLSS
jgi:ATP citrate (pro-S)-lyase